MSADHKTTLENFHYKVKMYRP